MCAQYCEQCMKRKTSSKQRGCLQCIQDNRVSRETCLRIFK